MESSPFNMGSVWSTRNQRVIGISTRSNWQCIHEADFETSILSMKSLIGQATPSSCFALAGQCFLRSWSAARRLESFRREKIRKLKMQRS
jgi:hypothetical protein